MQINELVKTVHDMAKAKGWYDTGGPTPLEKHMLIVSEIAEASEEVRNKQAPFRMELRKGNGPGDSCEAPDATEDQIQGAIAVFPDGKPEGEAVELADAMIRIADIFGHRGWDLQAVLDAKITYNATRPHRHGGKAL